MEEKELTKRLDALERIALENQRALRGSNGDAGLVADVRLLTQGVDHIKQFFENDLKHLSEILEEKETKTIKWMDLLKQFVAPILVSVLSAWLTAKLLIESLAP